MRAAIIRYVLIFLMLFPAVSAWARHDQMTSEVVRDLGWLDRFDEVTVTEYLYDDPSIYQTKIRYYNDKQMQLGPSDFYFHALYEPILFYKGAKVGSKISAKQLLEDFSNEPDWEMDQNLQLSWMQAFSGESQGYRHMYYPTLSIHIPMGLWAQGKTPERAAHFYELAKIAFANKDTYWGFRFLARALHYEQDMAQPYHTRQLYWRFISAEDPYYGTIQTIKNYHFTYESYIANLLRLEQQDVMPSRLISALRYSLPVQTEGPAELAKYIALRSFWRSSGTMELSMDFFGDRYLGPGAATMSAEEFFADIHRDDAVAQEFNADAERRVALAGKATKSFLEFARKDLNLDEYSE
jgi:hypothetical protein